VHEHATEYLARSHGNGFRYRVGEMVGLDRERRLVHVGPVLDEDGRPVTQGYARPYDTLVMAAGSGTNDFGTLGVAEHAIALETPEEAGRFHRRLVNACLRAHMQAEPVGPGQLNAAIVGAGAAGVELAAELHKVTQLLTKLGVRVRAHARATSVDAQGVLLASGERIEAELVVWAAGVKAPAFLKDLGSLETNRLNQLVVGPTLQSTRDERIYAIGDCGAAPWLGREAGLCLPLRPWHYRDFGSLVSLGEYSTVGNLMGSLVGGNLWVEGLLARTMYLSLYKMHEVALHGWWKTALRLASRWITRSTEPRVKLH
jgi:NADH:ubiquinone reductase (H+-translocating)